ncbi:MAG: hypothetical protein ACI4N8_09555 [Megasphaera sp.]
MPVLCGTYALVLLVRHKESIKRKKTRSVRTAAGNTRRPGGREIP